MTEQQLCDRSDGQGNSVGERGTPVTTGIKNLPTRSGMNTSLLCLQIMCQEFREDAVGMAVSAALCLGLSWVDLKLDMP